MSYEEWAAIGQEVRKVKDMMQWELGDWINYGVDHFGELYAQGVSDAGIGSASANRYIQVSTNVPKEIRRNDLTWAHHNHVAVNRFTNPERVAWLNKAAEMKWSSEELYAMLRPPPPPNEPPPLDETDAPPPSDEEVR